LTLDYRVKCNTFSERINVWTTERVGNGLVLHLVGQRAVGRNALGATAYWLIWSTIAQRIWRYRDQASKWTVHLEDQKDSAATQSVQTKRAAIEWRFAAPIAQSSEDDCEPEDENDKNGQGLTCRG